MTTISSSVEDFLVDGSTRTNIQTAVNDNCLVLALDNNAKGRYTLAVFTVGCVEQW